MTIRPARSDDLAVLVEIERAAGDLFRQLDPDLLADHDPGSVEELLPYANDCRAFVSVDAHDRPVGYLLVDLVDGAAHIEQVSVHPDHARQGIGRTLIERADVWARERDLRSLTLTTYVDVPWNAPYYARCGFRVLAESELGPELRATRDHEATLGLDPALRVCMRRDLL